MMCPVPMQRHHRLRFDAMAEKRRHLVAMLRDAEVTLRRQGRPLEERESPACLLCPTFDIQIPVAVNQLLAKKGFL